MLVGSSRILRRPSEHCGDLFDRAGLLCEIEVRPSGRNAAVAGGPSESQLWARESLVVRLAAVLLDRGGER